MLLGLKELIFGLLLLIVVGAVLILGEVSRDILLFFLGAVAQTGLTLPLFLLLWHFGPSQKKAPAVGEPPKVVLENKPVVDEPPTEMPSFGELRMIGTGDD